MLAILPVKKKLMYKHYSKSIFNLKNDKDKMKIRQTKHLLWKVDKFIHESSEIICLKATLSQRKIGEKTSGDYRLFTDLVRIL